MPDTNTQTSSADTTTDDDVTTANTACYDPACLEPHFATDMLTPIPHSIIEPILASPPFIPLLNGRDIGLVPGSAVRPSLIYRSGQLTASQEGWDAWLSNNVRAVVDFRHSTERERAPEPSVPGVQHIWFEPTATYRPDLDTFIPGDGSAGWAEMYLRYLRIYAASIRAVLEHIHDEGTPILYHCSAGRDRTGVMSGVLHGLSGTPEEVALHDFMLTRVGIEPGRRYLEAHARDVGKIESGGPVDATTLSPAIVNMLNLRPTSWLAFSSAVREEYGGWEGYVQWLGFEGEQVEVIKRRLRR